MYSINSSKKSKKILLFAHNWDYLPLRPYHVGLHLSGLGYRVCLIVPGKYFAFKYQIKKINRNFVLFICPTVLWGSWKKGADPWDLIWRLYLMPKLKADLIIAFDSRPNVIIPAVLMKLLRNKPLIIDWTDWFGRGGTILERSGKGYRFLFERIETYFEESFRKYAEGSTVICSTLETRLRSLGYQKKILNFPLGCNTDSQMKSDVNAYRRKVGLPAGIPIVGCVGTLLPADADLLFRSFDLFPKEANVQLLLIGENVFKKRYRKPEKVIETGKVTRDDLMTYIRCCDLMVMPMKNNIANNGRWPSKLNDYLSAGKPVVSTPICVVNELMEIKKFGEIAEDGPEEFARKMVALLNNKRNRIKYGRNAFELASGCLHWNTIMVRFNKFMMEFIN